MTQYKQVKHLIHTTTYMKLPDLPKQNKEEEAKFGIKVREFLIKQKLPVSTSIELKQTEKSYIPFDCITAKQIAYANKISSEEGVLIRVVGLDGQPDYIWMINSPSYLAIKYPKGYVFMSVSTFVFERDTSKRKSLTWERAQAIAIRTVCI